MADPGMPIPTDFDEVMRLSLQTDSDAKFRPRGVGTLLEYFNEGLGGLLYRFASCTEHDEAFTANVLANGNASGFPERYRQERDLFDFFVNGQSSIECLSFGLHALGAMNNPAAFPMSTDKDLRAVSPETTTARFKKEFAGDQIARSLDSVVGSVEYQQWKEIRNLLSHRVHPGRVYNRAIGGPPPSTPTAWSGIAIDQNTTRQRRRWLAAQIPELLRDAHTFVAKCP